MPALGACNAISQTPRQVRREGTREGSRRQIRRAAGASNSQATAGFNSHAAPVPPSSPSKLDFMPAVCTGVEPLSGRLMQGWLHNNINSCAHTHEGWHTYAANMQACLHVQALRRIGLQHEGRVQVRQHPLQLRQHLHSGTIFTAADRNRHWESRISCCLWAIASAAVPSASPSLK